mgnify:CR=1 FL=1
MNIEVKESDEHELMAYQIALLSIQVHINKQLSRIQIALQKIRKENGSKKNKWTTYTKRKWTI